MILFFIHTSRLEIRSTAGYIFIVRCYSLLYFILLLKYVYSCLIACYCTWSLRVLLLITDPHNKQIPRRGTTTEPTASKNNTQQQTYHIARRPPASRSRRIRTHSALASSTSSPAAASPPTPPPIAAGEVRASSPSLLSLSLARPIGRRVGCFFFLFFVFLPNPCSQGLPQSRTVPLFHLWRHRGSLPPPSRAHVAQRSAVVVVVVPSSSSCSLLLRSLVDSLLHALPRERTRKSCSPFRRPNPPFPLYRVASRRVATATSTSPPSYARALASPLSGGGGGVWVVTVVFFFFVCRVGWWSERGREGTRRGGGGGGGYCSRDEQLRWHQLRRLRWYVSFHWSGLNREMGWDGMGLMLWSDLRSDFDSNAFGGIWDRIVKWGWDWMVGCRWEEARVRADACREAQGRAQGHHRLAPRPRGQRSQVRHPLLPNSAAVHPLSLSRRDRSSRCDRCAIALIGFVDEQ